MDTMWFFVFATPGWPFSLNPGVSNSFGMFGAGGWGGRSLVLRWVPLGLGMLRLIDAVLNGVALGC